MCSTTFCVWMDIAMRWLNTIGNHIAHPLELSDPLFRFTTNRGGDGEVGAQVFPEAWMRRRSLLPPTTLCGSIQKGGIGRTMTATGKELKEPAIRRRHG